MNNNFQTQTYKVAQSKPLNPTVQYLRLEPGLQKSFIPGQFLMVSVPGFGEAPFTPASSPNEKKFLELGVRKAGQLTDKLASLKNGDKVYIHGPHGNGYPIEKMKNKDLLIITGGCGLIPLRLLISYLGSRPNYCHKITMLIGARSPEELIFRDEYPAWKEIAEMGLIVDEADEKWQGEVGPITNLVEKIEDVDEDETIVISCGPEIMYKFLAPELLKKGLSPQNIYFSIERRMRCGIGLCQHCTCGEKYVCQDGPVFSLQDLVNYTNFV